MGGGGEGYCAGEVMRWGVLGVGLFGSNLPSNIGACISSNLSAAYYTGLLSPDLPNEDLHPRVYAARKWTESGGSERMASIMDLNLKSKSTRDRVIMECKIRDFPSYTLTPYIPKVVISSLIRNVSDSCFPINHAGF